MGREPSSATGSAGRPWGLHLSEGGRHRRPAPPVVVHLVFGDGSEVVLADDSPIVRSMGHVAAIAVGGS
jgi:hypothetical protein